MIKKQCHTMQPNQHGSEATWLTHCSRHQIEKLRRRMIQLVYKFYINTFARTTCPLSYFAMFRLPIQFQFTEVRQLQWNIDYYFARRCNYRSPKRKYTFQHHNENPIIWHYISLQHTIRCIQCKTRIQNICKHSSWAVVDLLLRGLPRLFFSLWSRR